MNNGAELGTCAFCEKSANYNCPKCSKQYCSLACYKSTEHEACSKSFQQSNAESNAPKTSKKDQRRLLEILEQFEANSSENNSEWKYQLSEDLEKTKENIEKSLRSAVSEDEEDDLDPEMEALVEKADVEELWNMLTEEEKEGFKEMIEKEEL